MNGDNTRIPNHLPRRFVLIAAVNRIAKKALHRRLICHLEKLFARQVVKSDCGFVQTFQSLLFIRRREAIEFLPILFLAIPVHCSNTGPEEFRRRERKLVSLTRRALRPRSLLVEAIALAPCSGQLAINESRKAEIGSGRRQLIGRHEYINQSLDECSLRDREKGVAVLGRNTTL